MADELKVTVELRDEINLRKLARAVIALAQQTLDKDQEPEETEPIKEAS
jgi:hypothetical protein